MKKINIKLYLKVICVAVFCSTAAYSQTEINRVVLTDAELNSRIGSRSSVCLNVYFGDGQENKNEAEFRRKVKKHQVGFDINYWVKDNDRTNNFRVLNYDMRDYHLLLITDYYWDCSKFNDLLSSQTPSINYSFKNVRASEDSTKFEFLLMKNEGHCQLSGDFEVFFPIVELIIKEQEVSMYSSNRLLERRIKSSDDMVKLLDAELKKIDASNKDLKNTLEVIKLRLDDSNIDSSKLIVQLSYLPELKGSQLSNQALSAKVKFRLKNSLFNVSLGYGHSDKHWITSSFDYSQQSVNSESNVPMSIVTQGRNIQDNCSLKCNAAILGCEYHSGNWIIGLDSWLPINSILSCENKTGVFNYYGISDQVLEPIENIPSFGLLSNVSYVGEKSVFKDVMKTRIALHAGYEINLLKNMSFLPSLCFISKSKFMNIPDSENLTNELGQYSSVIEYAISERNLSPSWYLNLSVCFKVTK